MSTTWASATRRGSHDFTTLLSIQGRPVQAGQLIHGSPVLPASCAAMSSYLHPVRRDQQQVLASLAIPEFYW